MRVEELDLAPCVDCLCIDGPWAGQFLHLSRVNGLTTAWLELGGECGRYRPANGNPMSHHIQLQWERRR